MISRPPPAPSPILQVCDLGVSYQGVRAIGGIHFQVNADDFVVVLGPSGAGKSTLMRVLNRLNLPTEGRLLFDGRDVTFASGRALLSLRQNVGMVFQQFNLVGRQSVLQNVLAGRLRFNRSPLRQLLSCCGVFSREDRDIARAALAEVGILAKAGARADQLSGGQQQRVAIARLIAQEPRVILADEPIASLDPSSAEAVMVLLRKVHETHRIPVVVNLHQIGTARLFAKRILGMRAGSIVFDGPPAALDAAALRAIYGQDGVIDGHEAIPAAAAAVCP